MTYRNAISKSPDVKTDLERKGTYKMFGKENPPTNVFQ